LVVRSALILDEALALLNELLDVGDNRADIGLPLPGSLVGLTGEGIADIRY
jgi:hypothetical protein